MFGRDLGKKLSTFGSRDLGKKLSALVGALVLAAAGVTAIAVSILGGNAVREQAFERAKAEATATSADVQRALENGLNAARGMASSFEGLRARNFTDRIQYAVMLQKVLEDNPNLIAVWTSWEPGAFDGKDRQFRNAPGSDAGGRYMPYWLRQDGEITLLSVLEAPDPTNGQFYERARQAGHELIMSPTPRKIGDKEMLVVRLVVPIKAEGTFAGTAGVDVALDGIQSLVAGLKPFGTGRVALISAEGRYVATQQANLVNTMLEAGGDTARIQSAVRDAKLTTLERIDAGNDLFTALVPVTIGNTKTAWTVMVDVPISTITAAVPLLRNTVLVIALLAFLASAITAYYLLRRLVTFPLARVEAMIGEMHKGHLSHRVNLRQADEIGRMAGTLDRFAEDLQLKVLGVMQKIAAGDLTSEVDCSDPKDEIGPALKTTIDSLRGLVAEMGGLSKAAVEGKLAARGDVERFQGGYREIVLGVNDTLDAVIGPLNMAAEYVDRISKGDIPPRITDDYQGDFNEIKINLNTCIDAVNALVADTGMLAKGAVEGRLAVRADAAKHGGDFRRIVEGINDTLDSVIGPLNMAAEYVDRISKGDIPPAITDAYQGDFNEIKNNLNTCIDAINALVSDTAMLAHAAVEGKLATRADASKHGGDFRKIVDGVNATLDAVIGPLNVTAECLDRISKGDIPPRIGAFYSGDFDAIKNNLNTCIDAVNALVADAGNLARSAVEGNLGNRVDASRHGGDFRRIVEGFNATLDAVIGPLNMAATYVDRIGKGDIPPKITETYRGAFDDLKNNLNACIDGLGGLVEANGVLQRLSVNDLSTNVSGSYQGIFADVATATNNVHHRLDRIAQTVEQIAQGDLGGLKYFKQTGKRSEADRLVPGFIAMIEAIQALVREADELAEAVSHGRLGARVDAERHHGEFRRVIDGLNRTLDTVTLFLDAIPMPLQFMDREFKVEYLNQTAATLLGKSKAEAQRFRCSELWHTSRCSTRECPCQMAMDRRDSVTCENDCSLGGKKLDLFCAAAPMRDGRGDVVGSFEFVVDQTAIKQAGRVIEKQARYQDGEVEKLVLNLAKVAAGDLAVRVEPAATDVDTEGIGERFATINASLMQCVEAIGALVRDAAALSEAAVAGRLGTRADATRHQGDFRKIMDGVNRTLDAVTKPLAEASEVLAKIAQQDLRAQVQGDYVGDHAAMKSSINTMVRDLRGSMLQIGQNAHGLGASSEQLTSISQQMAANAEETATQTGVVSAASEQVSKNLTIVATSSEEMLASIREIAKSANEAARMAKDAVGVADTTNVTVQKLGDSSQEIGNVIKVITSIAEQTNLLALNATIEAARAGDAGKGFAVVANEVKELAKETAKATEEISHKIEAIQLETKGAVQAIGRISGIINQIDEVSNTIATAVEEQTATTNEIGRNITEAARGSAEIARNVSNVAEAAQSASQGASETQKAARSLSEMAAQLQGLVGKFSV